MSKFFYVLIITLIIQHVISTPRPTNNNENDDDVFSFASYYADHMVLQRAPYKATIWGYAVNRSIVSLTFMGKQYNVATTNVYWTNKAIWKIVLDPVLATTTSSVNLTFTQTTSSGQKSTIQLNDVLFGDVWICSGQSNMERSVGFAFNGTLEAQNSYKFANKIRVFTVEYIGSRVPVYDLLGITENWSVPSEESIINFSATCWYFGKNVVEKTNVPQGLVVTCWGGTNIERWSSPQSLTLCDTPKDSGDSILWNSMVHPLLNMTINGAIWYQGEQNANYNNNYYNCTFPAMIDDWRIKWFEGTEGITNPIFPFGFVQLANFAVENASIGTYPSLRWHQTANYGYAPNPRQNNVFMATAVDLVDNYVNSTNPSIIHPRYKSDVGYRLSLGALYQSYGMKTIEYLPPILSSITYSNSVATLKFVSDFQPIQFDLHNQDGFDVCCDSKQCLFDDTTPWQITLGIKVSGDTVSFNLPSNCKQLMYVRYLWRQKPCEFKQCSLYSASSQLPVYPFIASVAAHR